MSDLGPFKGIRFFSDRPIPKGFTIRVEMLPLAGAYLPVVTADVPGGPVVTCVAAVIENEIVLDDSLFFEHEAKPDHVRYKGRGGLVLMGSKIS